MNNFQQQQMAAGSNFRRGPGNTGIGMGVGRSMGGQGPSNYGPGYGQNHGLPNKQYAAEDPDDDFEDDDFGDVDEHQENDANLYKNTEAREEQNFVENKMMQARNFNPPSQRQHQINRNSHIQQQPSQYSFAGQSFNPNQNQSYAPDHQTSDSHFHQMSQNVINIQTGQNRIEAYQDQENGSLDDGSRDSNPRGLEQRKQSEHNDFFERQQKMIQESKMRIQQQNQQPPGISHMPETQTSAHRPGVMRGNTGPSGTMQNNYVNDINKYELNEHQYMEGNDMQHQRSQAQTGESSIYDDRYHVAKDAVEGTKNFDKAYDKLVKKFYHEEGANLLIPQEDMMIHEFKEENRVTFNIEERQKKYAEQERKKQEKIRMALIEKERKEMEECSFAPKLHKKKSNITKGSNVQQIYENEQRRVKPSHGVKQSSYQGQDQMNKSSSRANEATHDDELDQIRDVETFVADQERFLQQKRIKEQIAKQKQLHEEEQDRVPKINKKSRVLLQQRQERIEQQKLQEKMEKLVNDENYQSLTSRLKKPTTSLTRFQRDKSQDKGLALNQQVNDQQLLKAAKSKSNIPRSPKFKPQISKNTDQLVEQRKKRLQQNEQLKKNVSIKQSSEQTALANAIKPSDKYLIQKFNKEFDAVRDQIIRMHPVKQQQSVSPLRNQHQGNFDQQQYSPDKISIKQMKQNNNTDSPLLGAPLNYLRFKDMLIQLGLLTEMSYAKQDSPERQVLYDLWKILRGEEREIVYVENLRAVVQVILRLIDPKRVIDVSKLSGVNGQARHDLERNGLQHQGATADEMTTSMGTGEIGFKNERGQLCVRTTEVQKIQSIFNVYYLNRLQFYRQQLEAKKSMQQMEENNKLSFKPQIATNSTYLANERKRKIAKEMGLQEKDMEDEELMDAGNFLMHQGNLMKYKKQQIAKKVQEEKFKKEHTFEPDTKLTKNKVIPKYSGQRPGENIMRTSVSSINLDGIARKRQQTVPSTSVEQPFDQDKKPRHAELYNKRKRQIDKTDKSKEDYEFERQGKECTFAPKLMSNPKYLRKTGPSSQKTAASHNISASNSTVQQDGSASQVAESKKSVPQITSRQRQQLYEQKQLERMKKAREEKLRKNAMFERGEPKTVRQAQQPQRIDTQREIMQEQGVGDRVNNMQTGTSPTMQQRQAMLGTNRFVERNPHTYGHDEIKYRSRHQAENFDHQADQNDLLYPDDPENNDHFQKEDDGPMSLTINTKQFDENFNDQPTHEQMISEDLQFQLDEQAADQTVKQEFFSRRIQNVASNEPTSSHKKLINQEDNSQSNASPTTKQDGPVVSQSRKQLQQKMSEMPENFGLDENNRHGNMFDDQPGPLDLDSSVERIPENQNQQRTEKQSHGVPIQEESFQNSTMPQQTDEINALADQEEDEYVDQEEEPEDANDNTNEEEEEAPHNQQQPLLFVDINLGGDEQERIVVYEGDTAVQLAHNFCAEHNLDEETQEKLQELLEQQMAGVLPKVDEEEYNSEEEEEEEEEEGQIRQGMDDDGQQDYGAEHEDQEEDDNQYQEQQQHDDGYRHY